MSSRVAKKYLRCIKSHLIGAKEDNAQLLSRLACDVDEYLSAHPDVTVSQLEAEFGAPEAYARASASNLSTDEIQRQINSRKTRNRIWFITGIIISLLVFALVVPIAIRVHQGIAESAITQVEDLGTYPVKSTN